MMKILSAIIAFLLMLFPTSGNLLATQQQLSFPGEKEVAKQIVDAIIDGDVDTLVDMYSEESINTGEITTENIENIINAFEGNINRYKYLGAGGSDYSNYGIQKSYRQLKIEIETSEELYVVYAIWVISDTANPEKVGLEQITVFDSVGYNETFTPIAQVPTTKR